MKIKNVLEMYYNFYEEISLNVEMINGMSGRYRVFTKEKALEWLNGWLDEEVTSVDFEPYQTHFVSEGSWLGAPHHYDYEKKEVPTLYIQYSEN